MRFLSFGVRLETFQKLSGFFCAGTYIKKYFFAIV